MSAMLSVCVDNIVFTNQPQYQVEPENALDVILDSGDTVTMYPSKQRNVMDMMYAANVAYGIFTQLNLLVAYIGFHKPLTNNVEGYTINLKGRIKGVHIKRT